jgi:nucleotide-binding universal stress UspA family protein
MKRILIPTDYSNYADFAITSGAKMAKKIGAEVILLHVMEEELENKQKVDEQIEMVKSSNIFGDTPYKLQIVEGNAIGQIVKHEADYIIMGSHIEHGFKGFFKPTNSERVAKLAKCPVITLKHYLDLSEVNTIVYPTDMRNEQDKFIPELKALQQLYDAKLHVVKVFQDGMVKEEQVEKRLTDFAEFYGLTNYTVQALPGINEALEISNYALDINADLIALLTHERNSFERWIGGYVSGSVIRQSHIGIYSRVINPSDD